MKYLVLAYFAVVGILSLAAFVAYGFDKRRAQASGRRVPEKTLYLLALFGGWPGGLLGQKIFRHKTQKFGFRVVFWLCVTLHLAAVSGAIYLWHSQG